jgi:hypothetical protein
MAPWRSLWIVGVVVLVVHAACSSDDDEQGSVEEGLRMCCELGALCHEVGVPDSAKQECHVVGHENDPGACRENYARCKALCAPAGEGGEGGEPMEHACL